jgi:hypothetical protein
MDMSPYENAGRGHNINIDNISFESVEDIKYFETNLTDQNTIVDEIRSRLKSGNACYHSVQNFLSFIFLSKNIKTGIYKPLIFPVVSYGCETWFPELREVEGV